MAELSKSSLIDIPLEPFPVRAGDENSACLCTYTPLTVSIKAVGTPLAERSAMTPAVKLVMAGALLPKASSIVGRLVLTPASDSIFSASLRPNTLSISSASIASTTTSVLLGSKASGVLAATASCTN